MQRPCGERLRSLKSAKQNSRNTGQINHVLAKQLFSKWISSSTRQMKKNYKSHWLKNTITAEAWNCKAHYNPDYQSVEWNQQHRDSFFLFSPEMGVNLSRLLWRWPNRKGNSVIKMAYPLSSVNELRKFVSNLLCQFDLWMAQDESSWVWFPCITKTVVINALGIMNNPCKFHGNPMLTFQNTVSGTQLPKLRTMLWASNKIHDKVSSNGPDILF